MINNISKVKDFINKEKCKCGNMAVYFYAPSYEGKKNNDSYYCENCVNRGCSCNYHHSNPNDFSPPLDEGEIPEGIEGKDWKWVEKQETETESATTKKDGLWIDLDEKGREYPCCEFMYDSSGFDKE